MKRLIQFLFLALFMLGALSEAFATVTTYNDRPTYLAAATPLGSTTSIDFSTYDNGSFITVPGSDIYIDPLNLRDVTFAAQSYYNDKIYTFPNATYPLTLPKDTYAFGMDLAGFYATTGTFTVTLSTGDVYLLPFSSSGPYLFEDPIFFGAVSDTPIQWATVHFDNGYHMMDEFTFTRTNLDNCPSFHNPNQIDTDNDNIGDACDTDGLVSHWTGDRTASDAFDGNHGSVLGSVGFDAGYSSSAFSLNGQSGGWVQVPDSPSLSITGSLTLAAWIRPNQNTFQQAIIEKYDVPGLNGYFLRFNGAGKLEASVCGPTPGIYCNTYATGATTITTGRWHHVAAVYDGLTIKVYLDGVLDGTVIATVAPTDGPMSLKLGARGDDANTRLNGRIDEAKIFNRALSDAEIAGLADRVTDTDDDGVTDEADNCVSTANPDQADSDADGQGDACDADDDNDGVADDTDNCPFISNAAQEDNDADGIGDACDADDDNDGIADGSDNCLLTPNADQADSDADGVGDACDADNDNDGVLNSEDNCQFTANPDQLDTDADGFGDACDAEDDNDGVPDNIDNCPFTPNPTQADNDADGIGDACDADDDNDNVPDSSDNCQFTVNPDQNDTDGDGAGDSCDADDDNDGRADPADNCPFTANPDQLDFDLDGIGDACDPLTGPPQNKEQCKNGGWMRFNVPRPFNNQGDCIQFVNNGH